MSKAKKIIIGATTLIGVGILTAIIWALIPTEWERMNARLELLEDPTVILAMEKAKDIKAIRELLKKPEADLFLDRWQEIGGKVLKIYYNKEDPCTFYMVDENEKITIGREGKEGCVAEEIRNKVKEVCFGTGVSKKIHHPNLQCYFTFSSETKLLESRQAILDWREGKMEKWVDQIQSVMDANQTRIEEWIASDGSVWTLAANPPKPELIEAIKEGLEELIKQGYRSP